MASSHMSFDVYAGILKMSFLDWQSHNTAASALVRALRLYTYHIPYLSFSHVATNRSVICDSDISSLYAFVLRIYRGSYMSAHVLFNLVNELRKRDKILGLPSIISLFHNEFDKFDTGARMLAYIYHMILT